jgi:hypothetical protein
MVAKNAEIFCVAGEQGRKMFEVCGLPKKVGRGDYVYMGPTPNVPGMWSVRYVARLSSAHRVPLSSVWSFLMGRGLLSSMTEDELAGLLDYLSQLTAKRKATAEDRAERAAQGEFFNGEAIGFVCWVVIFSAVHKLQPFDLNVLADKHKLGLPAPRSCTSWPALKREWHEVLVSQQYATTT